MITYKLPRRIRFIPATANFTAVFNTPTAGKYDFAGTSQSIITTLQANSIYLIDCMTVGGNIDTGDYLDAINVVPVINLRKTLADEAILQPIQISGFFADRQLVTFLKTGLNNLGLKADIVGSLNQTAALIGIASIQLVLTLTMYLVEDSEFEKNFSLQS